LLIGAGAQVAGVDMVLAGNIELVVLTLGMTLAWTASYVFRVANKVPVTPYSSLTL